MIEITRSGAKNQRKHSQPHGCDLQLRDALGFHRAGNKSGAPCQSEGSQPAAEGTRVLNPDEIQALIAKLKTQSNGGYRCPRDGSEV